MFWFFLVKCFVQSLQSENYISVSWVAFAKNGGSSRCSSKPVIYYIAHCSCFGFLLFVLVAKFQK